MRTIVCRFDDESDFLRQFRWGRAAARGKTDAADFAFLGDFELEPGETIRLTALVSNSRDQCELKMRVLDMVPMAIDTRGGSRVFRYRARVADADAVWLQAFQRKMHAMCWIDELAA